MLYDGSFIFSAILLVFYLFLLAHFDLVKRPAFFLIGVLGLAAAFAARFFAISGVSTDGIFYVVRILDSAGGAAAFLMAVASCFCGKLPGVDKQADEADE